LLQFLKSRIITSNINVNSFLPDATLSGLTVPVEIVVPEPLSQERTLDQVLSVLECIEPMNQIPFLDWANLVLDQADRANDLTEIKHALMLVQQQLEHRLNQVDPSLSLSKFKPLEPIGKDGLRFIPTPEFQEAFNRFRFNLLARIHDLNPQRMNLAQCKPGTSVKFWYYMHIEKYMPGGFYDQTS